jgi:DNA repair protein RecN (Recombination protein N)
MLRELSIRNFAIIDDLQIRFEPGLTILSGETGAGKSIIINAVNLIVGSRAAAEMVRTGAESAELEALFAVDPGSAAGRAAAAMGYEVGDGLLVRRVISRAEGNRVYVNGRIATLQVLSAVTENLAAISGQHAHQGLLKEEQHLLLLDQFGGLTARREAVGALFREILPGLKHLRELQARKVSQAEQAELLEFQEREIAAAGLLADEDIELERERARLRNAGALMEAVQGSVDLLYGASGSATDRVAEARRRLEKMARVDPGLAAQGERLAEIGYRIEELLQDLRGYLRSVEFNDRRLEEVEQRLDIVNRLKRKYGGSLAAVFAKLAGARAEQAAIQNLDADIAAAAERLKALAAALAAEAGALSHERRKAAKRFASAVAAELATLKMPGTRFAVALSSAPAAPDADPHLVVDGSGLSESGIDRALFTIAPNIGEPPKPLAAIASGGELSRVVLALKSILAASESVATIVFDEVDAGIGGAVAEVVGRKLAALSRRHQVFCITHLPQIAKFADHHFNISKEVAGGRTRTVITPLSEEERTRELARMLGGETITRVTLEHARELLGRKRKAKG